MGLFKCKLCGRVLATESMSMRVNLCRTCFSRLEEMYSSSGIHDYIREHGLSENFDPEELGHTLKMNPRSIKLLFEMGFFERDIQVYNRDSKEKRKTLAAEFSHEIDRLKNLYSQPSERTVTGNEIKIASARKKSVSYGGRIYKRGVRS